MPQILFTPLAGEDLQKIWNYLEEVASRETADKFLRELKEKCITLAEFPESGCLRHDLVINLRSLAFKKYVIFYTPIEDGIEVMRIIHGSRNIEQVFDEMIPLAP